MKRAKNFISLEHRGNELAMTPKEFFSWMLDHTTIIAIDDPELDLFKELDAKGVIQLRIMDNVGCERFAEFLFNTINSFLLDETSGRVKATKVVVYEHERNSASYSM
jgi:6-pyruvoyltetrahydropterin/6-carboxytetrahydropterin synthase